MRAIASALAVDLNRHADKYGEQKQQAFLAKCRDDFRTFRKYCFESDSGAPLILQDYMDAWTRHVEKFLPTHHALILSPPGTGKTSWVVAYLLWRLGRDPHLRTAFVSAAEDTAKKRLGEVRQHIDHNERIREVFPNLRRAREGNRRLGWDARSLYIKRKRVLRDPSVAAFAMGAKRQGATIDLLVMEDPTDEDDKNSPAMRRQHIDDYQYRWKKRVRGGRIIVCAMHRWHDDDLIGIIMRDPRFRTCMQGVSEDCTRLEQPPQHIREANPIASLDGTEQSSFDLPALDETWTTTNLQLDKQLNSMRFGHQMEQRSMSSFGKTFDQNGLRMTLNWDLFVDHPSGKGGLRTMVLAGHWPVFITSDFSSERKRGCVILACARQPTQVSRKYVVDIEVGNWGPGPDMAERMMSMARTWHATAIYLEDAGLQKYFVPWFKGLDLLGRHPVLSLGGAKKKWDSGLGIPAIDAEFRRGEWAIPLGSIVHLKDQIMVTEQNPWCRLVWELMEHPAASEDVVMSLWTAQRVFAEAKGPHEVPTDHLGLPVVLPDYNALPLTRRMFQPMPTRMFNLPSGGVGEQTGSSGQAILDFFNFQGR